MLAMVVLGAYADLMAKPLQSVEFLWVFATLLWGRIDLLKERTDERAKAISYAEQRLYYLEEIAKNVRGE